MLEFENYNKVAKKSKLTYDMLIKFQLKNILERKMII